MLAPVHRFHDFYCHSRLWNHGSHAMTGGRQSAGLRFTTIIFSGKSASFYRLVYSLPLVYCR